MSVLSSIGRCRIEPGQSLPFCAGNKASAPESVAREAMEKLVVGFDAPGLRFLSKRMSGRKITFLS